MSSLTTISRRSKFLLMSYAGHGKRTMCDHLYSAYGLRSGTNTLCWIKQVYKCLRKKYGYSNFYHCWNDRHQHQDEWLIIINEYIKNNTIQTGADIWAEFDVYYGLRDIKEYRFLAAYHMFDAAIWIDAGKRVATIEEITVTPYQCGYILDNNAKLSDFYHNIDVLMSQLGIPPRS